jgi:hypothetical protein
MHPLVEQLTAVLAPPPGGGDDIDWDMVREESGMIFPADYRSFVETYGGGNIDSHLSLSTPAVKGSVYGVIEGIASIGPGRWHPEGYPYYPNPEGILPWGGNSHGDQAFWHCQSDDPDEWTVLIWRRHAAPTWKPFDGGMVDLLLATIRDGHASPFSNPGFPNVNSVFTSWRDESWEE